jgi:hypothetical protein
MFKTTFMKTSCFIKSIQLSLPILISGLLLGCGSGKMESTWTKDNYADRTYDKIAVIGIGKNIIARTTFERDAVTLLKENGINAVEGVSIFPTSLEQKESSAQAYIDLIKKNDIDGVITMALIDSSESERYQPGQTQYIPSYYRVGRYLVRHYNVYETPGFYTSSKSYLIEAVLYNVKGELYEGKETMVWAGQSSVIDPGSTASASRTFTRKMVNQLISDGIIVIQEQN